MNAKSSVFTLPIRAGIAYIAQWILELYMQVRSLDEMQQDLVVAIAQMESLSQVLKGQAIFLRSSNSTNNSHDIALIESQLVNLAESLATMRKISEELGTSEI